MQPVPHKTDVRAQPGGRRVLVFGAAGHAKAILGILGGIVIAGLLDDFKPVGQKCLAYEVLGGIKASSISATLDKPLIAVGVGANWTRVQLVSDIRRISRFAQFRAAIMAGAVVDAGSKIGPFCIVNTRAPLDHDCTIGIGAVILPSLAISRHSVIGAGSVVVKPLPDEVVAYGVPAKVIWTRNRGDKYLGHAAGENS